MGGYVILNSFMLISRLCQTFEVSSSVSLQFSLQRRFISVCSINMDFVDSGSTQTQTRLIVKLSILPSRISLAIHIRVLPTCQCMYTPTTWLLKQPNGTVYLVLRSDQGLIICLRLREVLSNDFGEAVSPDAEVRELYVGMFILEYFTPITE